MTRPKDVATNFLKLVIAGNIDEAYDKYVNMEGTHHNIITPAGLKELRQGMKDAETQFPNKKYDIKQIIEEGNHVCVYGHLVLEPGKIDLATVHLFRIDDGRIVEFWDCAQNLPDNPVNSDGAF